MKILTSNRFFVYFFTLTLLFACNTNDQPSEKAAIENNTSQQFTLKTYKNSSGWGYDIYINNELLIHQPTIPAIAGNRSFKSEEEALKTGNLVLYKIKENISPPSISSMELDSLGVIID